MTSPVTLTAVGDNISSADYSTFGAYYEQNLGIIFIGKDTKYLYLKGSSRVSYTQMMEFQALDAFVVDKKTKVKDFFAHNDALTAPATDGDYVVYEPSGEWVSYDISFLKAGTYGVGLEYSLADIVDQNFIGFDFIVDEALELKTYLPKNTTSKEAGKIYIPEGAKELKIKSNGIYTVKLKNATLERVGAEDTSEPIKISAHDTTPSYDRTNKKAVVELLADYYDKYCQATSNSSLTVKCDGTHTGALAGGGYHFTFTNGNVVSTQHVQHNPDEWSRYDISDLKPGNYKVTLNIRVPR